MHFKYNIIKAWTTFGIARTKPDLLVFLLQNILSNTDLMSTVIWWKFNGTDLGGATGAMASLVFLVSKSQKVFKYLKLMILMQ